MGVKLQELLIYKPLSLSELAGKKVVVDGCNRLFKYITTIRKNGMILRNADGDPVSHLIGFFYFCINLLEHQIRPIFVFDGQPPDAKRERSSTKIEKLVKMWKIYQRQVVPKELLTQDPQFLYDKFITDIQNFLKLMGLPVIRSLSEGEAQGARIVREGKAFAMISTDTDALLFGCPHTIKDIKFQEQFCTSLFLSHQLEQIRINYAQFIDIALLVGTDFNRGVKGIGPKTAVKLIREYQAIEKIPNLDFPFDVVSLREMFCKPATLKVNLVFRAPNTKQLAYVLEQYGFNMNRVRHGVARLRQAFRRLHQRQTDLGQYLKFKEGKK